MTLQHPEPGRLAFEAYVDQLKADGQWSALSEWWRQAWRNVAAAVLMTPVVHGAEHVPLEPAPADSSAPSNIVIQNHGHEEELDSWLKKRGLKILVHQSNIGWSATFDRPYNVSGAPAGPASGGTARNAVELFVNWMYGAKLTLSPSGGELVPRFSVESIHRAVDNAAHSRPSA